jgi:hypothetical protein
VKQLKWAIKFQRGHDRPSDEREEGDIPLVTSAGTSAFISTAAAKGPGIVTGRYGTIGEFYLIRTDYWPLNTSLYSIELRGNHISFLRYMLMHLSPLFLLNANKSAVPGVDRNDIHPTMTAVPPLPEQVAIAAYLDKETAKLDALVGKVEEAVERLQEYRTALITAAVTGKIDVRNHERHEKHETVEEEPDWEDRLNQVMQSRGRQPNLSFIAYTATPKGKTLELFGRTGDDGKPAAFHLYSMRQAIEEGFILDVVKNYTTYATYYAKLNMTELFFAECAYYALPWSR